MKYALAFLWLIFALVQVSILLLAGSLSGESSMLSNVVIDFAREGLWHYPVHAQSLFFPGIETFMIHPPLHYLFAAAWVDIFEIGIWQLHFQSVLAGFLGVALGTAMLARVYSPGAALFVPALAATSAAYAIGSVELRPDMSFGLIYSLTVMVFGLLIFQPAISRRQQFFSFLLGFLSVVSLSTHWFGYFVQLYLIAFTVIMFWRHQIGGLRPIIACAAGWLVALAGWYVFFGEDLLRSLIVVLIKGNEFRSTVAIPMSHLISVLANLEGSIWLALGLALGTVVSVRSIWIFYQGNTRLTLKESLPLFLFVNLLVYTTFFYFFVGNKSHQYAGNILFLAFPMAAIGYYSAIVWLSRQFQRERLAPIVAFSLSLILLGGSDLAGSYLKAVPEAFMGNGQHYNEARRAMNYLVPKDATLVVGVNSYPYLFDREYESTMLLVARHMFDEPGNIHIEEIHDYYQNKLNRDYRTTPFPIKARIASLVSVDTIALSDSGAGWQNLYYDPAVWHEDFREVGRLVLPRPEIARAKFNPGQESNYPRMHTVFNRDGVVNTFGLNTIMPRLLKVGKKTFIATPGRRDRHSFLSGDAWNTFSEAEQRQMLLQYMSFMDWYGATLDQDDRNTIVEQIYPHAKYYLTVYHRSSFNQILVTRSLSQAVDYAFSVIGYPDILPRVPELAWRT